MHRLLIISIPVFLLISTASVAVEMADLYVAEQRVSSQSKVERHAASAKALQTVLLKVVGDRSQLESILTDDLSEIAPVLLSQHQYYDANAAKFAHDNTAPEQLAIRLEFDEIKVNQQVLDWGLPIWSKTRPEILLLLVINDGDDKQILASESEAAELALEVAALRGIPIILPLMDLADYKMLDMTKLWTSGIDGARSFTARYQTPLLVVARIARQNDTQWHIQWQYDLAGKMAHWQSRGDSKQAMESGMDSLVNNLARQFSHVKSAESSRLLLEIEDVAGFVTHQKVMRFLSDLTYVNNVQQHALIEDVLTVSLDYFGSEDAFRMMILSEQLFMPLPDIINADRLYYKVKP